MIFRNLKEDHDGTFGKGRQNFAQQNDAIGLNIKTRILSWVGDCFFDQKAGIDWNNRLGRKDQRGLLELDLKRLIMQSRDVTGITFFDTIENDRNFDAYYSVNTIYSKDYKDSLTVEI